MYGALANMEAGLALPCVVPKEWVNPPDFETNEGELMDDDVEESDGEAAAMLGRDRREQRRETQRQNSVEDADDVGSSLIGGPRLFKKDETPPPRLVNVKDTSGRDMPVAERAPMPRKT